ncbi:hypothetical protein L1887_58674 [Cichorium endivia]|nr:hypothetical protein L1887_58674 [Cichorium endivia]
MLGRSVARAGSVALASAGRSQLVGVPMRAPATSPLLRLAHGWAREACLPARSPICARIGVSSFSTSSRAFATPRPPPGPSPIGAAGSRASRAASMTEEMQRRQRESYKRRNQSLLMYSAALMVFTLGFSYAAVPLYRAFCSATGFSGTPITDPERFAPSRLVPAYTDPSTNAPTKRIRVTFNADASDAIPWSFTPQQKEIYVLPGETALAFYTAKNKSTKDIIGIATYNVSPDRIAPYFAKVECFCFEEQKLLAGEEVDLPVFFFIDSDVLDDPSTKGVDDVVLSYTFFSARRNPKNGQLECTGYGSQPVHCWQRPLNARNPVHYSVCHDDV